MFKAKFCAEVDALKFGNPWEEGAMLTPLPEVDKPDYIQGLIADAVSKGAAVLNSKTKWKTSYISTNITTGG